jgi:hypothetical protein
VVRSFSSLTNILWAWDVPSSMLWVRWELLERRHDVLEKRVASCVNHGIFFLGSSLGCQWPRFNVVSII